MIYCAFDENGTCLTPPNASLLSDIWQSLRKQHRAKQTTRYFQIQVWTTAAGTVPENQAAAVRQLLLAARDGLRQFVINQGAPADNTSR